MNKLFPMFSRQSLTQICFLLVFGKRSEDEYYHTSANLNQSVDSWPCTTIWPLPKTLMFVFLFTAINDENFVHIQ
ncbi:unnamed protein product [Brassica oleracea var. botrytis]